MSLDPPLVPRPGIPGASARAHIALAEEGRVAQRRVRTHDLVHTLGYLAGLMASAAVTLFGGGAWSFPGFAGVFLFGMLLFWSYFDTAEALSELEEHVPEDDDPKHWEQGAIGEEATGALLEPLGAEGFVILHDRQNPDYPGNIDHIVIGPTGIFVIDSKNWSGEVNTTTEEVYRNRVPSNFAGERPNRRVTNSLISLLGQSKTTWRVAGSSRWVTAVLCVHSASLTRPESQVRNGWVLAPERLADFLRRPRNGRLPVEEIARIAAAIEARMPIFEEPPALKPIAPGDLRLAERYRFLRRSFAQSTIVSVLFVWLAAIWQAGHALSAGEPDTLQVRLLAWAIIGLLVLMVGIVVLTWSWRYLRRTG